MDCAETEGALPLLLNDDLEQLTARALWLHLAGCRDCRELLANLFLARALCRIAQREWRYRLAVREK
jgi:predicted anti-sigma-YlaC factor YlaD